MMRRLPERIRDVCCLWPLLAAATSMAAEVDYTRDIKPLFAEKCISCHGPLKQESGLRLDAAKFIRQGGDSGEIARMATPEASLLLHRVKEPSEEDRMPPKEDGSRLTGEQISLLERWIAAGLPAPDHEDVLASPRDHWAFQPIQRAKLPNRNDGHPIDRLIGTTQDVLGVQPLPAADPVTLLRRVTLDLVGLPPGPDEVLQVSTDPASWSYEQTVDRLLASPQYGERWGRHWMDVWRYSDWDGYKKDVRSSQPHIWRWRDWIVQSLNEDKPYDQMIVEMLAGDELAPEDPDVLRATGFLVRNFHTSNRDIWMDATVEHTMKAFVGMTVNCARCHDHKYDPIPQQEYFALRAIFEPYRVRTERLPGVPDLEQDGLPRVYDADLEKPTYLYQRGDEKFPDKEHPIAPAALSILDLPLEIAPVSLPVTAAFPSLAPHIEKEDLAAAETARNQAREQREKLMAAEEAGTESSASSVSLEREEAELRLAAAEAALDSLQQRWAADKAKHQATPVVDDALKSLPQSAAAAERHANLLAARRDCVTRFLALEKAEESNPDNEAKRKTAVEKALADFVAAGTRLAESHKASTLADGKYTAVGKSYPKTSTGRRLALAHWITNPQNPLTARVAINHIWLRHFGKPLVANAFDFGLSTRQPQQAALLDWLAAELIDSGWSTKHIHRLILTSDAYRRASASNDPALLAENMRLDPDNHTLWRANINRLDAEVVRDNVIAVANRLDRTFGGPDIDFADGEKVLRRSLYFRHAYEKQMTMLLLFDAPSPSECYQRNDSITPQQALALSNSDLSRSMARHLAHDLSEIHSERDDFLRAAFVRVLSRLPQDEELAACRGFLAEQSASFTSDAPRANFTGGGKPTVAASSDAALRARENLVHVLMNHNDFVTVR